MASRKKGGKGAGKARAQKARLDGMSQIWLAGLGAVSKAQRGAPQLLQELIAEGTKVQAKTRGAAEKAVRSMVSDVRAAVNERVEDVLGQASGALNDLEKIFQNRVHRALTQIGVPSAEDIAALSERVDALSAGIEKLAHARRAGGGRRAASAKPAATAPAAS